MFGAVIHRSDEWMRFTYMHFGDENRNNHGRKRGDCYCIRKVAKGVTTSRLSLNSGPGGRVGIHLYWPDFGNHYREQDNRNGKRQ